MALPTNVGKGTVRGKFIDSSGAPIEGVVTFKPTPKRLANATATPRPVTILPKPVSVPLVNGEFETSDLIATDDPDNTPVDWQYTVEFQFAGGASAASFPIELPEGTVVDLATVTPVASTGGVQILRGPGVPDFEGVPDGRVLVLADGKPTWAEAELGGGVSSWNDLTDKPATFTPAAHSHAVANVTGLQAALDAKADAAATTSALAGKANSSHSHGITDMPAGSIIRVAYTTTGQARPTARTDVTVWWVGGPTTHPTNAISGDIHTPDMEG